MGSILLCTYSNVRIIPAGPACIDSCFFLPRPIVVFAQLLYSKRILPHLARTADSGRDTGSPGSRGTGNQSNGRPGEVVTGKRGRQATGVVNQRNPARPRPRADEDSGKIKVTSALNFGQWNPQTMRKLGKLEMVEKEMADHDLGCLGLSETRWTGKGHFVTDLGSTVIYSGLEDKKASGVAVMLDRMRAKSLLGYNPISDRILTVRLAAKPWNVTIIQIYAPTNQAPESESIHFYSCLQQVVSDTPKQDVMIICGDFNAKIGEGAPIGKEALGKRNENGQRLIDFAIANRLIAANAITRQHARKKYTWRSFNGLHRNQIDYVLVQKRWQSAVAKCRSYPETCIHVTETVAKTRGLRFYDSNKLVDFRNDHFYSTIIIFGFKRFRN